MSTCREGTLLRASTWPFNRNMLFLSSLLHALELHALQSAAHATKLKGYGSFCADMCISAMASMLGAPRGGHTT